MQERKQSNARNTISLRPLAVASLFLISLLVGVSPAAAAEPVDSFTLQSFQTNEAGATGDYVFRFNLNETPDIAPGHNFTITFPEGYALDGTSNFTFVPALSFDNKTSPQDGRVINATLLGNATEGQSYSVKVTKVTNPNLSQTTGKFDLNITNSAGTALQTGQANGIFIDRIGQDLGATQVSLTNSAANSTSDLNVSFVTTSPLPDGGQVVLVLNESFVLSKEAASHALNGSVAMEPDSNETDADNRTANYTVDIGSDLPGGSTVWINVTNISVPAFSDTFGDFSVYTTNAAGAQLDSLSGLTLAVEANQTHMFNVEQFTFDLGDTAAFSTIFTPNITVGNASGPGTINITFPTASDGFDLSSLSMTYDVSATNFTINGTPEKIVHGDKTSIRIKANENLTGADGDGSKQYRIDFADNVTYPQRIGVSPAITLETNSSANPGKVIDRGTQTVNMQGSGSINFPATNFSAVDDRAGATTDITIRVKPTLDAGGVRFVFPDTFDLSGAAGGDVSVSGQYVNITNFAISAGATKNVTLEDVRLPQISGFAGAVTVRTTDAGNTHDISGATLSQALGVEVNELVVDSVTTNRAGGKFHPGDNTTVLFDLDLFNPIPAAGALNITLTPGFKLLPEGALAENTTIDGTTDPGSGANDIVVERVSDEEVRIIFLNGTAAGDIVVGLPHTFIPVNELGTNSTPNFTVETNATGQVGIDTNRSVNVTFEKVGSFTSATITPLDARAGQETNLTFAFTSATVVGSGGNLTIDFPADFDISGVTRVTVDGTAPTLNNATSTLDAQSLNVSLPTGLAAGAHNLIVSTVGLPDVAGATGTWNLTSNRTNGGILDQALATTGPVLTPAELAQLNVSFKDTNKTGELTYLLLNYTIGPQLDEDGSVRITLPSGFNFSAASHADFATSSVSEVRVSDSGNVTVVSSTVREFNVPAIGSPVAGDKVFVNVTNVTLALGSGVHEGFQLLVKNGTGRSIEENTTANVSLDPNELYHFNVSTDDTKASAAVTYLFSINATNAIPAGGIISIYWPEGFDASTATSATVDDASAAIDSKSKRYVNVTAPALAAGTLFEVEISGVTNGLPGTYGQGDATKRWNVTSYITAGGRSIDVNFTGETEQTVEIAAGALTATVQSNDTRAGAVGAKHWINITTTTAIPAGGNVSVTYPAGSTFAMPANTSVTVSGVSAGYAVNDNLTGEGFNVSLATDQSPGPISIVIDGVINADTAGTHTVWVRTNGTGGSTLDNGTGAITLTPAVDTALAIQGITYNTAEAGRLATVNLTFQVATGANLTAGSEINITFPVGFDLGIPGTVQFNSTSSATSFTSAASDGRAVLGVRLGGNSITPGTTAWVNMSNVRLPMASGQTGVFEVFTNNTAGVHLQSNRTATSTIRTSELGLSIFPASSVRGDIETYTFTVDFKNSTLPGGSQIRLQFPTEFSSFAPGTPTVSPGSKLNTSSVIVNTTSRTITVNTTATFMVGDIATIQVPNVQTPSTSDVSPFKLWTNVSNTDGATYQLNDTVNVTLAEGAGIKLFDNTAFTLAEGSSRQFNVTLDAAPGGDVELAISITGSDIAVSPAKLFFGAGNHTDKQAVTVTAIADNVDEAASETNNIQVSVVQAGTHSSYDAVDAQDFTVTITDTDTANFTVGASSVDLVEGASQNVSVVLDSKPSSGSVVITLSNDNTAELTTTPANGGTLTFTAANWNVVQNLTLLANDDSDLSPEESATVSLAITSGSGEYTPANFAARDIDVAITDDEAAEVIIDPTTINVEEGGDTDTYTIVLGAQPSVNVIVTLAHSGGEVTFSPSTPLTFTAANWDDERTITVTAVDDSDPEGDHAATITHTVASSDTNFNGIAVPSLTVNIDDNDVADATISESELAITEGATDTFSVVLDKAPTASVTVTLTHDGAGDLSLDKSTLTFTTASWATAQVVTATGVQDTVPEGNESFEITLDYSSTDAEYHAVSNDTVEVTVVDDDHGVIVDESSGSTNVTEGGGTDSYTLRLSVKPTQNVSIAVSGDANATANTEFVNFTVDDWASPKSVAVTAVDDDVEEGDHTATIRHGVSSSQSQYNAVPDFTVTVGVTDNDAPVDTITDADITTANGKVILTVTRENGQNKLTWTLPADVPGTVEGIQIWFSNSPYTLLASYDEGTPVFNSTSYTHAGDAAKATTTYLVTMFYEGDVGKFTASTAPDTNDFAGTAADADDDGKITDEWWFWLLIVLAILLIIVIIVLIILAARRTRGEGDDDWDDDDGWEDEPVEEAPAPVRAAPVAAPAPKPKPARKAGKGDAQWGDDADEEIHHIQCPRCSQGFDVGGAKPIKTTCPNCHAFGILR